jgi:Methyltransferase domain
MKLSWLKQFPSKLDLLLKIPDELPGFEGRFFYRRADKEWPNHIPIPKGPMNYLEIGCADGGNAILVSKSYCHHPDSKVYCVDPWIDYEEYPEYKGRQEAGWKKFNQNIQTCADVNKFIIHRGFSHDIVPTFPDNFFDLIFVDGNHETEYVYRDGLMSLEKVKVGGYIIFDDYSKHWLQTVAGVDKFLTAAGDRIKVISNSHLKISQLMVQRIA